MRLVKSLLLLLLGVWSVAASAQTLGSIRGTLKAKSGEPGIALTVRLQDTQLGATTDTDGLFVITGDEIEKSGLTSLPEILRRPRRS
ncbi:MAG: hypothetical protein EOO63_13915, partial [Hymenobacter sp.]